MITLDDALARGRGIERPFCCPVHEDRQASASVNVVNGYWYCYACAAKGTIEGHVPDPNDALKALEDSEKPPRIFAEAWLDIFDAHHPSAYWAGRFGKDVATLYRCGTDPMTGAPTYPLRTQHGAILGVVQRVGGDQKYKYPYGPRTSQTLFLSHKKRPGFKISHSDVVVLTEGASDVLAFAQAGIPATWRVAGCFGAGTHLPQASIIADMTPKIIVTAFNNDKAGHEATERTAEMLGHIAPVLSVPWGSVTCNDIAEMDTASRIHLVRAIISTHGHGE